jgi:hypothetical protein
VTTAEWAIRRLVDRYATALDQRDRAAFESLWTPDALLEVFQNGPARPATGKLRAGKDLHVVFERLGAYALTLHHVTTHQVVIGEDYAAGTTYCEAHHLDRLPDDEPSSDLVMHIRYADEFAADEGVWRIRLRRVEVLFTEHRHADLTPGTSSSSRDTP